MRGWPWLGVCLLGTACGAGQVSPWEAQQLWAASWLIARDGADAAVHAWAGDPLGTAQLVVEGGPEQGHVDGELTGPGGWDGQVALEGTLRSSSRGGETLLDMSLGFGLEDIQLAQPVMLLEGDWTLVQRASVDQDGAQAVDARVFGTLSSDGEVRGEASLDYSILFRLDPETGDWSAAGEGTVAGHEVGPWLAQAAPS